MNRIRRTFSNIKFIFIEQIKVYPMAFVFSAVIGMINCLIMGITIIMPKMILDTVMQEAKVQKTIQIIAIYAVIIVVLSYLNSLTVRVWKKGGYYLPHTLMYRLAKKMIKIDYKDVETKPFNEAYKNAENAVFKLTEKGDELIRILLATVFQFIMIITVVATIDKLTVLIILICAILQIWLDIKINQNNHNFNYSTVNQVNAINYPMCVLRGFFPGIKDVITYEGQNFFLQKMQDGMDAIHRKYRVKQRYNTVILMIQYSIRCLEIMSIYLLLMFQFQNRAIAPGYMLMYITAAGMLKEVLDSGFSVALRIGETDLYMKHYWTVMNIQENIQKEHKDAIHISDMLQEQYSPEIEFCNVSFKYSDYSDYALRNVSFKLRPGERLVLIGENGAGKTTLVKLLLRLYDVTEGCIKVNGIDIKHIDYEEYQELFAAVFQDYQLFDCSIGENIGFDNLDVKKIKEIMGEVGLNEYIDQLDREIHSERGNLSGGERQMIAIGRAIYKNAKISVFDEITSAIDPIREAELYRTINNRTIGKSMIYISHRLSVCAMCDNILLLDNGKILEYGTHNELIKKDGKYAELFHMQADKYR